MKHLKTFENKNSSKLLKYTKRYENGQLAEEKYYINGNRHREDGPAFQEWYENGQKKEEIYYINGNRHREDGPANESWYENGQKLGEEYYINNKLHREDGPATLYWFKSGIVEEKVYFLYNTDYDREEWIEKLKEMDSPHYEEQKKLYELEQDMEKYNL